MAPKKKIKSPLKEETKRSQGDKLKVNSFAIGINLICLNRNKEISHYRMKIMRRQ